MNFFINQQPFCFVSIAYQVISSDADALQTDHDRLAENIRKLVIGITQDQEKDTQSGTNEPKGKCFLFHKITPYMTLFF